MFHYIRLFTIVACVLVIAAAIGMGYYFRSQSEQNLRQVIDNSSISLVNAFQAAIWNSAETQHMLTSFSTFQVPPSKWQGYRDFHQFADRVFRFFDDANMVQVSLYHKDGTRLLTIRRDGKRFLSSQPVPALREGIGDLDPRAYNQALTGQHVTDVLENSVFPANISGTPRTGTLLRSYVPMKTYNYSDKLVAGADTSSSTNIEGIVEFHYDVSENWRQLVIFQYTGPALIAALFMMLLGLLWIFTHKAEVIIARQHESNIELTAQAAAAEAESRNKSLFLANISHELRTPLNAIIGFSEFIKNETAGPIENPQYAEYIKDIHSSGVHLLSLINDILDYSKAEAGKLDLVIEEVDITKVLRNSIRLVSPRAEQAQVQLVEDIPKEHFILHTDAKKLKQVMLNLLSNAVKFTSSGGAVKTTVWRNLADESIMVEVKDSGIGIAPKDISRAMAPFGQVDNALSRKYEGTGLGLPLTRKFVELMGGQFSIQSELNVGTTVTFSLPKTPPEPKDARNRNEE
jgi:two-component system cell cycle sensor histidine kinase PleC